MLPENPAAALGGHLSREAPACPSQSGSLGRYGRPGWPTADALQESLPVTALLGCHQATPLGHDFIWQLVTLHEMHWVPLLHLFFPNRGEVFYSPQTIVTETGPELRPVAEATLTLEAPPR